MGARGVAQARCNDGRTFKVDFTQTSETGGFGQGLDDRGNIVQVFFDENPEAIEARIKKQRIERLLEE